MTAEYLTKLKTEMEMEERLGCGIEVVEDSDSIYPCKMEYARNYGRPEVVGTDPANRPMTLTRYPDYFGLRRGRPCKLC